MPVRAGEDRYALRRLTRAGRTFDLVVMDPPRTGAHPWLLRSLRDHMRPRRVIYISCDPETLARDLQDVVAHGRGDTGYDVVSVTPVDMFPHTTHVETVAVLDRV